jgi:hypothetical protein
LAKYSAEYHDPLCVNCGKAYIVVCGTMTTNANKLEVCVSGLVTWTVQLAALATLIEIDIWVADRNVTAPPATLIPPHCACAVRPLWNPLPLIHRV